MNDDARQRDDGLDAARGLVAGLLYAAACWGAIALAVWLAMGMS